MTATSLDEFQAVLNRATEEVWRDEPDEARLLRLGLLENGAGTEGQYWSTLDFANGMIRDFSMYTMYPILRAAEASELTLEALRRIVTVIHPPYTIYLRYSGYLTLSDLDERFRALLPQLSSKDEFVDLYSRFLLYTNKLAAWSYHYFTWEVGALYPQRSEKGLREETQLLERLALTNRNLAQPGAPSRA